MGGIPQGKYSMTKIGLEFLMFLYSSSLPHEGKILKAPSGGSLKTGPQGLDSLLGTL